MSQHSIERIAQRIELVAGVDVSAKVDIPATDFIAHRSQVVERIENDVTKDPVNETKREGHRHHCDSDHHCDRSGRCNLSL